MELLTYRRSSRASGYPCEIRLRALGAAAGQRPTIHRQPEVGI